MDTTPSIIMKTHELLLYIIPQLEKLPRTQKFILGDRVENKALHLYDLFIESFYSRGKEKLGLLQESNLVIEQIRLLVRLLYDLKYINLHKYEVFSNKIMK